MGAIFKTINFRKFCPPIFAVRQEFFHTKLLVWIDKKKFDVAMEQIYELGKIIGGLVKFYAKNNKKYV